MGDARIDAGAFALWGHAAGHYWDDVVAAWDAVDDATKERYRGYASVVLAATESASECEKLKAALAALLEEWDPRDHHITDEGICAECHSTDCVTVAARALVGSVPPNEADDGI